MIVFTMLKHQNSIKRLSELFAPNNLNVKDFKINWILSASRNYIVVLGFGKVSEALEAPGGSGGGQKPSLRGKVNPFLKL